jgi:DnaJ-domain-containing protein 1
MSEQLKSWLKEKLVGLVGVQQAVVNPPAEVVSRAYPVDIRALLWTGVIVNIYVLQDAIKPRTIRQILQHDTSQGIGSMFIIAPHLAPAPGAQFVPPEWMMNIHALIHERLYAYPPENREMGLIQIHLERIDATERYEAIYGPQLVMDRLHYGRITIKQRAIKGYWLTAHFGPAPFWQQERRRFYVPPPRSHSTNGSVPPPTPGGRQKTELERSYEILGVHLNATQEEVKTAFRRQVFNVHPDVSALPKIIAEEKFRMLAEAYEYIKAERGWV